MKNGLYLLALIFLAACTSDTKKTTEQKDSIVAEPTYWDSIQEYDPQKMNLVIGGKQMELIYFKQNEDMVFKALEIEKSDDPFHQISELKYDVTNDGVDDSIIFYIDKLDTFGFEKGIRIFSNNRLVFQDSAIADSSYLEYQESIVWLGDSALNKLLPYSLLASLDWGSELESYFNRINLRGLLKDNESIISSNLKTYAEHTSENPSSKQRDMMVYLNIYTGQSVSEIMLYEPGDELIYIWYSPDSSFIPVYSYSNKKSRN